MQKDFDYKIDSILGGHSPASHFGRENQFRTSLAIDPGRAIDDTAVSGIVASGLLVPVASEKVSSTTLQDVPYWIITDNPKETTKTYVYDGQGSAYSLSTLNGTFTGLSDAGHLSSSSGNGARYYDNYIYFAKNTDIARYGPLNGSPSFNGTYWTGTLSKTALVDTTYPNNGVVELPNHVMCRHSDGKLYFGDVVGNQGVIHYISTTKTTVEGDTDNSSTYNALDFGYGLWPTAIESYGNEIIVGLYEGNTNTPGRLGRAKLAFWDTTSSNFNRIVWVEFPDQIITAIKNVNGILYVISANNQARGFRVSRFIGGYTFQEVDYIEQGYSPIAGGVDGVGDRLVFGSSSETPEAVGSVFSYGLQKASLSKGIFNVMRATGSTSLVTALALLNNTSAGLRRDTPVIGWTNTALTDQGIDVEFQATDYSTSPQVFWSKMFTPGRPFKITKIRIPLAQAVAANMTVTAKLYTDDGAGTTYTYQTINNTNFPSKRNIILRSDSAGMAPTGEHNFWLELRWTGSARCIVGLPITIEGVTVDD